MGYYSVFIGFIVFVVACSGRCDRREISTPEMSLHYVCVCVCVCVCV